MADIKSAGGIPISARDDNTAATGLRGWWHRPRAPACNV